jgi:tetratricopeptide (TPR) repeat protein
MKKIAIFLFCFFVFLVVGSQGELIEKEDGIKALNSGNYDRAIEIFKAGVDKQGDNGKLASYCSFFLGRAYYEKGQMEEAIKYLKRAGDIYKEGMVVAHVSAGWYYWLGRAYYNTGQYNEAIVSFQKASSMAYEDPERAFDEYYKMFYRNVADRIKNAYLPHMPPLASCYFWLGNSYYMNSQYQDAVEAFIKAIELNPKAEDYYTQLANSYLGLKQFEKAIQAAKRSIGIEQNNAFAYHILSKIYRTMGKYDEAIDALKRAIELEPKVVDRYISLADLYSEQENYSEAINTLKKALEIEPNNVRLYSELTNSYMAAGRFDDAIKVINKAVEDIYVIRGIGIRSEIKEKYPVVISVEPSGPAKKAGIEVGDRIIKINGQSTKGWDINKTTENLRGQEGTQVALTIERKGLGKPFEKTITREKMVPGWAVDWSASSLGKRSLINAIKGNFEEARQDVERAYALNPNDLWAKSAMSFTYIIDSPPLAKESKITEAIKILSSIQETPFGRLLEALAYSKMGDLKKSFDIYTLIPEDYLQAKSVFRQQFIDAALESLKPYIDNKKEAAKSLEAKGQYSDALKEYAELLKIVGEKEAKEIRSQVAMMIKARPDVAQLPEEARRYVMRAEMATKESKFDDALKEYKEAIKIVPFSPALYKAIALNYEALKDYRQAIKNMNIYLDLYPEAPDAREAKDQIYKWEYMLEKEGK